MMDRKNTYTFTTFFQEIFEVFNNLALISDTSHFNF